jgi:biopolymer transport protein ExbD
VTATVGELAPVVSGVTLPEARVGTNALQQLTLGVGRQVTLAGTTVMNTIDAAQSVSDDPSDPLLIPTLYTALRTRADSIRAVTRRPADQPVDAPLAIQGDRTMRYDLLSRIMQTARMAGFRNLSLQVRRVTDAAG